MGEHGTRVDSALRDPADPEVLATLVDNHARFLAFVERRVGSREDAEDILQEAFVRGIDRAGSLRSRESAIAWFYRLLRNALVDHHRRRGVEARALVTAAAREDREVPAADEEMLHAVCGCVERLLDTLRPEYGDALRRVDVDEVPVRRYAEERGITPNNAGVRVHRARLALRKQLERSCGTCVTHGCFDCTCDPPGGTTA
jgi:RNA polymerase sigma-70 factor (ECF subfamily)